MSNNLNTSGLQKKQTIQSEDKFNLQSTLQGGNTSLNFAQKEFTNKILQIWFPKKDIDSPKNNTNEDPKGEMDGINDQKLDSFNEEFRKQFLIESKTRLANLMNDLDLSKDENNISSTKKNRNSNPSPVHMVTGQLKRHVKKKTSNFLDREETLAFHQKLIAEKNKLKEDGLPLTEANLNNREDKNDESEDPLKEKAPVSEEQA